MTTYVSSWEPTLGNYVLNFFGFFLGELPIVVLSGYVEQPWWGLFIILLSVALIIVGKRLAKKNTRSARRISLYSQLSYLIVSFLLTIIISDQLANTLFWGIFLIIGAILMIISAVCHLIWFEKIDRSKVGIVLALNILLSFLMIIFFGLANWGF